MPTINPTLPTVGEPRSTEDVDVLNALTALVNLVNGNLDDDNIADGSATEAVLSSTVAELLGITRSGTVRRGKAVIAAEETRTNAAFGLLATPDRVQGVVLPTDGLLLIGYRALWKASASASTNQAAIFLNGVQLRASDAAGAESVQAVSVSGTRSGFYRALSTAPFGLATGLFDGAASDVAFVTTGRALVASGDGGLAIVEAAAGTYDVSVQFKTNGTNTVTVKERKLWVWTMGF